MVRRGDQLVAYPSIPSQPQPWCWIPRHSGAQLEPEDAMGHRRVAVGAGALAVSTRAVAGDSGPYLGILG